MKISVEKEDLQHLARHFGKSINADVIELRKEYIGVSLSRCNIFLKFEIRKDSGDIAVRIVDLGLADKSPSLNPLVFNGNRLLYHGENFLSMILDKLSVDYRHRNVASQIASCLPDGVARIESATEVTIMQEALLEYLSSLDSTSGTSLNLGNLKPSITQISHAENCLEVKIVFSPQQAEV